MKNLFYLIILLLTISCDKVDLQDKAYEQLEDFSVLYPKDTTMTIVQYDTLRIDPTIINQDLVGNSYSYEWKCFGGPNDFPPVIITTEKKLDVVFEYEPGSYFIQFDITDNKTGIKQINLYSLIVNDKFGEGWLVASNKSNQGLLSFISINDQFFVNPISEYNKKVYAEKTIGVQSVVYNDYPGMNEVFYFTDKGMYRFNAGTFMEIEQLNSLFTNVPPFSKVPFYDQDATMGNQFLIENGKVYSALAGNYEEDMGTFSDSFPGNRNIFPFLFATSRSAYTLFYDNTSKQFVNVAFRSRVFSIYSVLESAGVVGKEMIGADFSNNTTSPGVYLCLMKNSDGKYHMNRFTFTTTSATSSTFRLADYVALPDLPGIDNISGYAVSSKYLHAYYSTGNKVYMIDFSAANVKLLYEFPEGTIADLKMYKRPNRYYQSNPPNDKHNTILVAALNKINDQGEVHYIPLNALGTLDTSKEIKKFSGMGTIKNISYRNQW